MFISNVIESIFSYYSRKCSYKKKNSYIMLVKKNYYEEYEFKYGSSTQ